MAATESTGLNAAYVAQLREDYLDSPASVPDEWRRIFDAADGNGGPMAAATGLDVLGLIMGCAVTWFYWEWLPRELAKE